MNKKLLFGITNALLVGIVGLLVGLFCKDIFATPVGTASFITLLIALCIPAVIYLCASKAGYPAIVMCALLMLAEVAISIGFMVKSGTDAKVLAITQACVVGAFLIAMLVFIATAGKKEEE